MNGDCLKIVVACGGTGGHVVPGLATAAVLRRRGHEAILFLTGRKEEDSAASLALAKAGGFDERIRAMKDDPVPEARPAALLALGYAGARSDGAGFQSMLLDGDRDPASRAAAAVAAGLSGAPGASESLLMGYSVASDPRIRGCCLVGLRILGADDVLLEGNR